MAQSNIDPNAFIGIKEESYFEVGFHRLTGITRYRTSCCALGSISLSNFTSKEIILDVLNDIKKESDGVVNGGWRYGGERAIFVTTLPNEEKLEENLKECGFTQIYEFHRRNYNPENSMLKLWIISW